MNALEYLESTIDAGYVFDFEFKQTPGNNPLPVCVTLKNIFTGKTTQHWLLDNKISNPFPYDIKNSLFICHFSVAEVSCMIALGLEKPKLIWDTFVQEKKLANGLVDGFSLLNCCSRYGISTMSEIKKKSWRDTIINNYPNYTDAEKSGILDYNKQDVIVNEKLFLAQLEKFEKINKDYYGLFSQAVFHGRSMGLCAQVEANGIPVNYKLYKDLENNYEAVKNLEIQELNKHCDLYINGKFSHQKFEELLIREGLHNGWPRTKTGELRTDDRTLYRYQTVNEKIARYRNSKFIINARSLKGFQLGQDKRSRASMKMFGQISGRTNLSTATNPFGAPRRMRNIIGTDDGVLVYLDWKSQEAAIQAFLSSDKKMIEAVKSGDPYMHTAKLVKAVPDSATKKTYPKEREIYKTSFLAIAYDQTPFGLKEKLNKTISQATYIHGLIKKIYITYFIWNNKLKARAMARGYYETKYGWKYHITPLKITNPRRLTNWPIQSCGSEILRHAHIALDEAGFEVSMLVHDAVLLKMDKKGCAEKIKQAKKIMGHASYKVIGYHIPVDCKIIRKQFYQDDDSQKRWDELYKKLQMVKGVSA
jgi:DNA polymerase I-like protein with 3'-5' exonuclease and polymerase domains